MQCTVSAVQTALSAAASAEELGPQVLSHNKHFFRYILKRSNRYELRSQLPRQMPIKMVFLQFKILPGLLKYIKEPIQQREMSALECQH